MKREVSYFVIALHRIVNRMDRGTAALCGAEGLTLGQFAVLEALYHKGELSVGEIKEAVLGSDGTIPVVVGNLARDGLVTRHPDPEDRRRSIVSITEAGRARVEAVLPKNEELLQAFFDGWSAEEKKLACRLLAKLTKE